MLETYISFYLKENRIHIFVNALRGLGSPPRICFMIEDSGETLMITPYKKRDLKSHSVSPDVYHGTSSMEVSSMKLCRIIAEIHHWDLSRSYRVPGTIHTEQKVAVFSLTKAEIIDRVNTVQTR